MAGAWRDQKNWPCCGNAWSTINTMISVCCQLSFDLGNEFEISLAGVRDGQLTIVIPLPHGIHHIILAVSPTKDLRYRIYTAVGDVVTREV